MEARHSRGAGVTTVLRAPLGAIEQKRRPLRFGHVLVTIEDLLIVTWAISEDRLRMDLPSGIQPVIRRGQGLVSAVIFRNRALRPVMPPFPRIASCQMNLRSYILDPKTGEAGSVFFHGLYVSHRWLARASSWMFGTPSHYLPITIATSQGTDHLIRWEAASPDGFAVRAHEAEISIDSAALDLVTNPHTGYFLDRNNVLRTWSIWHRPQELQTMVVERTAGSQLARLGLTGSPAGLYVRSIDYEVYLPPRAIRT